MEPRTGPPCGPVAAAQRRAAHLHLHTRMQLPLLALALLLLPAGAPAAPAPVQLAVPPNATSAGIPIDSSVILLFMSDLEGGDSSQCARMARRAMDTGGRTVNFVVTGYYISDSGGRLSALGYVQGERDRGFRPFTWDAAQRLGAGLARCMRVAVDAGRGLAVHIHLDDGGGGGTWRNALDFEPFTRYGELSYWDALVKPAASAARDANARRAPLRFALQAEMGATLFYYPQSYRAMVRQVKDVIAAGGTPAGRVRVGVNVNWEKACGCPAAAMDSTNYHAELKSRWREVAAAVSLPDVQALFRAVDWVGVSAYATLPPAPPAPSDLEASLAGLDRELRLFGVDLRSLGKELAFSEFGVGGGETGDYQTPARDWAHAAAVPYWGVDGRYAAARDPWARRGNRPALRRLYNATLQFAAAGGGPTYRVGAIFLWSIISFDVTGVHYMSYARDPGLAISGSSPGGPGGGYRDDVISAAIRGYNDGLPR